MELGNRLVDTTTSSFGTARASLPGLSASQEGRLSWCRFDPLVTSLFRIMFKTARTENRLPVYPTAAMPRLLPAEKCPKCAGPLKRLPTMVGTVYVCAKCDTDDPAKAAESWTKGELRPPK